MILFGGRAELLMSSFPKRSNFVDSLLNVSRRYVALPHKPLELPGGRQSNLDAQ